MFKNTLPALDGYQKEYMEVWEQVMSSLEQEPYKIARDDKVLAVFAKCFYKIGLSSESKTHLRNINFKDKDNSSLTDLAVELRRVLQNFLRDKKSDTTPEKEEPLSFRPTVFDMRPPTELFTPSPRSKRSNRDLKAQFDV